jgi:hypothetical protein
MNDLKIGDRVQVRQHDHTGKTGVVVDKEDPNTSSSSAAPPNTRTPGAERSATHHPHQLTERQRMPTRAERAERAKVDRWIADSNAKQILAYDKQVAEREELADD